MGRVTIFGFAVFVIVAAVLVIPLMAYSKPLNEPGQAKTRILFRRSASPSGWTNYMLQTLWTIATKNRERQQGQFKTSIPRLDEDQARALAEKLKNYHPADGDSAPHSSGLERRGPVRCYFNAISCF